MDAAGPRGHVAACTGVGLVVGVIAAGGLKHAFDPVARSEYLNINDLEAECCLLVGMVIVGGAAAAAFRSVRVLLAVAVAPILGVPALAGLLAGTLRGDAAGGADRFVAWAVTVAAVYVLAGTVSAPGTRPGPIVAAAVTLLLAGAAVAGLELTSQHRWRVWDITHQDVALALPDIPGYEPTGIRFNPDGLEVQMSGPDGNLRVDLLGKEASAHAAGRWPRYGDRAVRVWEVEEARTAVPADVPLRPVTADRLARLPVLPPEYPD